MRIIPVRYIKYIIVVFGLLNSLLVYPHNTNLTHNLLTEKGLELLISSDFGNDNYGELYTVLKNPLTGETIKTDDSGVKDRNIYRFWGYNPSYHEIGAYRAEDNGDQTSIDIPIIGVHVEVSAFFRCHRVDEHAGDVIFNSRDYQCFNELYRHDFDQTVLGGVIMEDTPINRVVSHFFHAYTGEGLSLDGTFVAILGGIGGIDHSSARTGQRFFNDSINIFGYKEFINEQDDSQKDIWNTNRYAKNAGYWLFGHFLHHLEDMSSIAHTHDDFHKTHSDDTDRYEAVYLPYYIQYYNRCRNEQCSGDDLLKFTKAQSWFDGAATPFDVNSLSDIWPEAAPNVNTLDFQTRSLARKIFNTATFSGDLKFPVNYGGKVIADPNNPLKYCGSGELNEMFEVTAADGSVEKCGVKYESTPSKSSRTYGPKKTHSRRISGFRIPDVGFFGKDNASRSNDWWALSSRNMTGLSSDNNYFYLEQIMDGELASDVGDASNLLVPKKLRSDITQGYSITNNFGTEPNTKSLLESYAEKLVPMARSYIAGATKHWFDIVNTPPYLKAVQVMQKFDVLDVEDTKWDKKYKSEWEGIRLHDGIDVGTEEGVITLKYEKGRFRDEELSFLYQRERYNRKRGFNSLISDQESITFCLTFNEPIRTPGSQDSGFNLGVVFGDIDPNSIEETPEYIPFDLSKANIGHVVSDVWNPNGEIEPVPIGVNTTEPEARLRCQRIVEVDKNLEVPSAYQRKYPKDLSDLKSFNTTEETWAIEILKEDLPKAMMKSKREERSPPWITAHLVVEARDKNNHWYSGTEMPEDAKGKLDALPNTPARRYVDNENEGNYLWHSKISVASDYYFPGYASSIPGTFSYDYKFADMNHQILFSYRDEDADAKRGSDGKTHDVSGFHQDDKERPPENSN